MSAEKCPLCGTHGKEWEQERDVFVCPNCSSIYSPFGLVLENKKEFPDMWS